jgi:uncharacterized protein (TIGR03435 family)
MLRALLADRFHLEIRTESKEMPWYEKSGPRRVMKVYPMPDRDSIPDLATALDRQLGLKLEARKGPIDTYVIERVERPSGN